MKEILTGNSMQLHQDKFTFTTSGRNTYNITSEIEGIIRESGIKTGLCHVFIHHTSASLIVTENADPDVRTDLETIMSRLAPDADPSYYHTLEGPDDMSAHVRCILTQTELTIPVTNGRSGLGTWQGVFLWEHRTGRFQRKLTITVTGI
jgi:secondary thiamine-phosphate synthase enzyme